MFYRLLNGLFRVFVYRGYRQKYRLPGDFRFNGFLIRFYGDGIIVFGTGSYISYYSYINVCAGSKLRCGNNVSIGHNVRIYTSSFNVGCFITEGRKTDVLGDIEIGDNVVIGANVFISPGTRIGSNVVVGANSFVRGDVPSNCSYGGVPGRVLRRYSN